jgi:hypothetical protein
VKETYSALLGRVGGGECPASTTHPILWFCRLKIDHRTGNVIWNIRVCPHSIGKPVTFNNCQEPVWISRYNDRLQLPNQGVASSSPGRILSTSSIPAVGLTQPPIPLDVGEGVFPAESAATLLLQHT